MSVIQAHTFNLVDVCTIQITDFSFPECLAQITRSSNYASLFTCLNQFHFMDHLNGRNFCLSLLPNLSTPVREMKLSNLLNSQILILTKPF